MKRRKIFGEGKYISFALEKENIWSVEEKKNGKGKKYRGQGKIVADGRTEVEGSIRGPRGPKNLVHQRELFPTGKGDCY